MFTSAMNTDGSKLLASMQLPDVFNTQAVRRYPVGMVEAKKARRGRPPKESGKTGWKAWTDRYRAHMTEVGLTQDKIAEEMGRRLRKDQKPFTQGAVGHWLSGKRPITLNQFFVLCEIAEADPMLILFEKHIAHAAIGYVTAGARQVIGPDPSVEFDSPRDKAKERVKA
jgi:hypothetical protein